MSAWFSLGVVSCTGLVTAGAGGVPGCAGDSRVRLISSGPGAFMPLLGIGGCAGGSVIDDGVLIAALPAVEELWLLCRPDAARPWSKLWRGKAA